MNITFIFDPADWRLPPANPKMLHEKWHIGTLELPEFHASLSTEQLMTRMWHYWEEWLEDEGEEHLNVSDFVDWLAKNRGWKLASNHVVATFNWPPLKRYNTAEETQLPRLAREYLVQHGVCVTWHFREDHPPTKEVEEFLQAIAATLFELDGFKEIVVNRAIEMIDYLYDTP